jgi:hypothetical protein
MSLREKYQRPRGWWDESDHPSPGQLGAGHSVSTDSPDYDVIDDLRKTVEEVTRRPVARVNRKIGFY